MKWLVSSRSPNRLVRSFFPRVYYGWWVTLAATLIGFWSYGLSFYGFGFYLKALVDLHGWSPGTISLSFTCYYLATATVVVFIGSVIDAHGSRPVLVFGAVVMGLSVTTLGFVSHVWQLFAIFLFMSLGWASLGPTGITGTVTPWFRRRRGTAITVALSGGSFGGMFLIPFLVLFTDRFGFQVATSVGGALLTVTVLFLVLTVIRRRPQDLGLLPDGAPADTASGSGSDAMFLADSGPSWTRTQVLRSPLFWTLVLPITGALSAQAGFIVHQISILQLHVGPTLAAFAVSVTTFSALIGRLMMGAIVDRVDKRLFGASCFAVQGIGIGLVASGSGSAAILFLGSALVGFGVGIVITLPALLTQEEFGTLSYGTIFAMVTASMQIALALGPSFLGVLRGLTGGYGLPLWLLIGFEASAASVLLVGRSFRSPLRTAR